LIDAFRLWRAFISGCEAPATKLPLTLAAEADAIFCDAACAPPHDVIRRASPHGYYRQAI